MSAQHTEGPWHLDVPAFDGGQRHTAFVISGQPPTCIPHIAYIPEERLRGDAG
jgi:hypothetical protein